MDTTILRLLLGVCSLGRGAACHWGARGVGVVHPCVRRGCGSQCARSGGQGSGHSSSRRADGNGNRVAVVGSVGVGGWEGREGREVSGLEAALMALVEGV